MCKRSYPASLLILTAMLMLSVGCSDDATTSSGGTSNSIDILDIQELVENVAPPEFTAPSGMPSAIDSIWTDSNFPLLEKVFGSREPQALYANINDFAMSMDIIRHTMKVDDNGDIITGTYVDSYLVDLGDGETMMNYTAVVTPLSGPTTVPSDAAEVLGETIDVDYLIEVENQLMPNAIIKIGMTINDSEQTLWQYDVGSGDPTDTESRSIYASMDPTDSSFVFKGVGYCLHDDGDLFAYAFNISSESNSDFSYRNSWYSNGSVTIDFLHTIVGGGNKDSEFALRYRCFSPADTTVADSAHMSDQLFGPNYTEGTGLLTDYNDYIDEDLIFGYDLIPMEMLTDPWEE